MGNSADAAVVWSSGTHVEVAVNDVTPPSSLIVFGGATPEVGIPVSMSAKATDVWSSPIVHWDFGDGTGVDGEVVSHTYSEAGIKTVKTSATDTAGNVGGSISATIQVIGKPGDRPPDSPPPSPRHVTLGIAVPKQRWKAIDKARAIKLRCSLDTSGACKATATVSRSVAAYLGLIHSGPKGSGSAKPVQIGVGSVHIDRAGHALALEIHLAGKARAAIDAAKQNVPVTLAVTGSASGQLSTSLTRKLTIARP
jgi:PKD repeat protein